MFCYKKRSQFSLVLITLRIVVLAPNSQVSDLLPMCSLVLVGDQAYHFCDIGKLNDGVGVVCGHGVQKRTEHVTLRGPCVEDQRGRCVVTLTTWGRPVRKSRIQLQREGFSPRVISLVMSFEGTMC